MWTLPELITELSESLTQLLFLWLNLPRVYHDMPGVSQPAAQNAHDIRQIVQWRDGHIRSHIASIWRNTFTIMITQAAPILLCAIAGFALPGMLHTALDMPSLEAFIRDQSTYCAFRVSPGWQLWVWGGFSLFAQIFTQGMVAAIALQGRHDGADRSSIVTTMVIARYAVTAHLPALLAGGLIYTVVMTFVVAGLSVPLLKLHRDLIDYQIPMELENPLDHPAVLLFGLIGSQVDAQWVKTVLPDPGALSCGLAGKLQTGVLRQAGDPSGPVWQPESLYRPPLQSTDTDWFWPITLGSLALMVLAGILLRFRSVAVLIGNPSNVFAGLTGARLAWQRFGVVTLHMALLRLAMVIVQALFNIVPTILAVRLAIPWMARMVWAPWLIPACVLLVSGGMAVVNSVLSAFAVVYDAQLFICLLCVIP